MAGWPGQKHRMWWTLGTVTSIGRHPPHVMFLQSFVPMHAHIGGPGVCGGITCLYIGEIIIYNYIGNSKWSYIITCMKIGRIDSIVIFPV